jgi:hypothetical protein
MGATVAVDLHRRRSVVLGRDEEGEELPWVRLVNEPDRLVEAVMAYGEAPDVAIEATYGWVRHEALCDRVGCKDPPVACRSRPLKLEAA